jgi:molybdopterin-containing oxidoreductase family iron-sulfur binding subunit
MNISRRRFLQIAGISILALAAKPAFDFLSRDQGAAATDSATTTGKRLAMAIDLKACKAAEGCVDCIQACNVAHNIPDFSSRKEHVRWIWEGAYDQAFPEQENNFVKAVHGPVLMLCNHCQNPPCVRVCPTQATWRREDGIVMMDYHRCIGCRYCMAACPYGSRSFNWRDPRPYVKDINDDYPTRTKGVVEKCNFCEERLAAGLQPACVAACKYGALTFGDMRPGNDIYSLVSANFTQRRKPELGTGPQVYYLP